MAAQESGVVDGQGRPSLGTIEGQTAGDGLGLLDAVGTAKSVCVGECVRGAFKAVFTFALPVLLVSNVPVRVLADKISSPGSWLLLVGVGIGWSALSELFWRVSVRRYTSASS